MCYVSGFYTGSKDLNSVFKLVWLVLYPLSCFSRLNCSFLWSFLRSSLNYYFLLVVYSLISLVHIHLSLSLTLSSPSSVLSSLINVTGEIVHWLKVLTALPQDPSTLSITHVGQLPITLAPKGLMPSSDLCKHYTHLHKPTHRTHTYIHIITSKIN